MNNNVYNKTRRYIGMEQIIETARNYAIQGDYEKAISLLQPLTESENIVEKLEAEYQIGYVHYLQGNYDEAEKQYKKTLDECIKKDLIEITGKCYCGIGSIYNQQGKSIESIEEIRKALKIFKETNNLYEQSRCLNNIGVTYGRINFYEEAVLYYSQSLAIAQGIGDKRAEGYMSANIAENYLKLDQTKEAGFYLKKAYSLFNEIGETKPLGVCYSLFAELYYKSKDYDNAERYFDKGIKLVGKDKFFLANIFEKMFKMYEQKGDRIKQKENLLKTIECYKELGNDSKIAEFKNKLVELEYITPGKPL